MTKNQTRIHIPVAADFTGHGSSNRIRNTKRLHKGCLLDSGGCVECDSDVLGGITMARYIDADNLIDELSAACMPIYEKGITGILGDNSSIADIINEQPTADVQEVKRGE